MKYPISTADGEQIEEAVSAILSENSTAAGFPYSRDPVRLQIEVEGTIIAGLTGYTCWSWLYIETLAVAAEHRGQGLGAALVQEAERIGRDRDCHAVWVDTFSFQAPEFYRRLGYIPFGVLPDFPSGQERIFFPYSI